MATLTYKGGKYRPLAGNKIYDGTNWNLLKGDSKIFLNGAWRDFGWEKKDVHLDDVTLPNYPGFDFDCGTQPVVDNTTSILYVTPSGAGNMDGSSWDNAFSSINTAIQYSPDAGERYIFCKEGIYNETELYAPQTTRIVGGFSEDGTWANRHTLRHPTVINCSGEISDSYVDFIGCVGKLQNHITGCIAIGSDYLESATDSVCINCTCDYYGFSISNTAFIDCVIRLTDYTINSGDMTNINAVFLNCDITSPNKTGSSNPTLFVNKGNLLFVNCKVKVFYNVFYRCDGVSFVNCDTATYSGDSASGYGYNYLIFNCNNVSENNIAVTDFSHDVSLGSDNSLTKFSNTGYYPQMGLVDVGYRPSIVDDPQGFTDYVNAFGNWRPLASSVLAGKGYDMSTLTTDLDGVTRPDPPTIGAYEAVPEVTE